MAPGLEKRRWLSGSGERWPLRTQHPAPGVNLRVGVRSEALRQLPVGAQLGPQVVEIHGDGARVLLRLPLATQVPCP